MRKLTLFATIIGAAISMTSLSAGAVPLGNPTGVGEANAGVVEQVHCRPGWRHHAPRNWRRADGCARRIYRGGGVVVVPRFYGPGVYRGWHGHRHWRGGRHHWRGGHRRGRR